MDEDRLPLSKPVWFGSGLRGLRPITDRGSWPSQPHPALPGTPFTSGFIWYEKLFLRRNHLRSGLARCRTHLVGNTSPPMQKLKKAMKLQYSDIRDRHHPDRMMHHLSEALELRQQCYMDVRLDLENKTGSWRVTLPSPLRRS